MAKSTAKKRASATNATQKRQRRELKPRSPRTYYAVDRAGLTLFRFANHPQRLAAIRRDKVIPLGALEFRNKIAEDIEGKLTIKDMRSVVIPETEEAPVSAVAPPGGGVSAEAIAAAVAAAIRPYLTQVQQPAQISGEQPQASRVANRH